MHVLVTGATGYIGGRLVPRLLEAGHYVRILVRDARRVRQRDWARHTEVWEGDLSRRATLDGVFSGVDAAYYLVHSMYGSDDFAARDREAAENFVSAGRGVEHVVYLGGLLPGGEGVSRHLRSRAEVGEILRAGLPTTEFRAGPIIGSGSASFEMVRYLTERIPAMVAPRWILNDVQPIGVRDVLAYLELALERGPQGVVDIGADRLTFREMMRVYAEVQGLRRAIVPVPVLAPRLAALWVGLVTPISNRLAVPLVEGVVHPVVADTRRARERFPEVRPMPYRQAVERALRRVRSGGVTTRWSGALGDSPALEVEDWEGVIQERRSVRVDAPPERVFAVFSGLGGERGWLVWDWAWELRGALDRLVGGPGAPPRPARCAAAAARRGAGLLARRGCRVPAPATPARGDEGAGQGVAGVPCGAGRARHPPGADGHLRPARAAGRPVLVLAVPDPQAHLQRHGARDQGGGGGLRQRRMLGRCWITPDRLSCSRFRLRHLASMYIQLLEVPYDSGHWGARMGRGPGALLAAGAAERLRAAGHAVETGRVTQAGAFPSEVATGFEVCRQLAGQVSAAMWHSRFPLVLAGNCLSSVGVLAGMESESTGIVWLDAHADYHTPETTTSGFVDGMALATATGRCWRAMVDRVAGLAPVRPENALLVGARDLDPAEPAALAEAGVAWVRPGGPPDELPRALDALRQFVGRVYLHLDLDVLDPAEGRANAHAAPGGLSLDELLETIRLVGSRFAIGAATLSAYDPSQDLDGRAREAGLGLLEAVAAAATLSR